MIRINVGSKSGHRLGIQLAINRAARRLGMHEVRVANILSVVVEEICNQVCKGRSVRIPGFGLFLPHPVENPKTFYPRAAPRFNPDRAFSVAVMAESPVRDELRKEYREHLSNHGFRCTAKAKRQGCSVQKSSEWWRKSLAAQARQAGVEIEKPQPMA